MKTLFILETVRELQSAYAPIVQGDASFPVVSGSLEVHAPEIGESGEHRVDLVGDPNFKFSLPFKDFVIQTSELAGIKLMSCCNIPA